LWSILSFGKRAHARRTGKRVFLKENARAHHKRAARTYAKGKRCKRNGAGVATAVTVADCRDTIIAEFSLAKVDCNTDDASS
jgi:hypothetical protein